MNPFKESTTIKQLIELSSYFNLDNAIKEASTRLMPRQIGNYLVPESLDSITFGMRLDLQELNTDEEFLFKPLELLAKMTNIEILYSNAWDVIRFNSFVVSELNRFTKRDETTLKYKFDKEELKAGISKVNHGVFGVIDVIAQRMGITHDEVLELGQGKVYMMLKIDIDNSNYQKQLRDVFNTSK